MPLLKGEVDATNGSRRRGPVGATIGRLWFLVRKHKGFSRSSRSGFYFARVGKVNKAPFCLGKMLSLGGRLRKLGGDSERPYCK